jgi:hypothetical protein
MSGTDEWSPDEPLDTETYESWDEALDERDELEPDALGDPEGERELDSQLYVDDTEAEEAGVELDDPEQLAVLDGGIDDPDGVGEPSASSDEPGWDLDAADRETAEDIDDNPDILEESDLVKAEDLNAIDGRTTYE